MKFKGIEFNLGVSKKFDKDFARVKEIMANKEMSEADRTELLMIYAPSYHDSGKIEGITSCDSSCSSCKFCQKMIDAAEKDVTIICGDCYDKQQEKYKTHVKNRHGLNMLIMSQVEFTEDELKRVDLTKIVRINSSGDTPNETYALNMIRLAKVNPWANVAYWAKNTAPIIKAVDSIGKPENLRLVQSSPIIGKPVKKKKYFDYVFTVYPDKATTLKAIKNGASACNGRKCKDCGYACYLGTHGSDQIAEVARGINKEKREAIIKALEAIVKYSGR